MQISVIVPVYNAAEFVARCIDSILNQSFDDFELLLIDDGSTDISGQICEEYATHDARIRVFHTTNKGVTQARRLGQINAKGEFLCFVDADDYIRPFYLMELYNALANGGDISYASFSEGVVDHIHYIKMLLRNTCDWGLPYKLYRSSLFKTNVFDTPRKINVGEDLITNIKICLNECTIVFIKCDGYVYYQNTDSITHSRKFSLAYEESFLQEVDKALKGYKEIFHNEIWLFKLRCWKNLVQNGIKVDRKKDWVRWVLANASGKPMTIGDKILIYVSNNIMSSFLLKSIHFLKRMQNE